MVVGVETSSTSPPTDNNSYHLRQHLRTPFASAVWRTRVLDTLMYIRIKTGHSWQDFIKRIDTGTVRGLYFDREKRS